MGGLCSATIVQEIRCCQIRLELFNTSSLSFYFFLLYLEMRARQMHLSKTYVWMGLLPAFFYKCIYIYILAFSSNQELDNFTTCYKKILHVFFLNITFMHNVLCDKYMCLPLDVSFIMGKIEIGQTLTIFTQKQNRIWDTTHDSPLFIQFVRMLAKNSSA